MNTTAWKALGALGLMAFLIVLVYGMGRWWANVDMAMQPSVGPQQALVRHPDGAIAVGRNEPFPRPLTLGDLVLARLEAGALPNPVPPDSRSLERGRFVYEVHCEVCHGRQGRGDGLVGMQFTPPPMDLTAPYVQEQPDGRLFYTVTHGGLIMPFFHDAIPIVDRWHVVNYVKHIVGTQ